MTMWCRRMKLAHQISLSKERVCVAQIELQSKRPMLMDHVFRLATSPLSRRDLEAAAMLIALEAMAPTSLTRPSKDHRA